MIKSHYLLFLLFIIAAFGSCSKKQEPISITAEDYHNAVDHITKIMINDIFSPPVASRVYAYTNIAAYEVVAQNNPSLRSFASEYEDFGVIPAPKENAFINYRLSALVAHLEIGRHLIFSEENLDTYRDSIFALWEGQNEQSFRDSQEYGMQVAQHIKKWIDGDNYKETRTMPKFSVKSDNPARWQPTPPSYMDGIEPHWAKIRPFAIDSASQFRPKDPPGFSLEEKTTFHQELMEVYDLKLKLEKAGDESEGIQIAKFWDCNPYVSTQRGHLMFATKK